jgi:hypothetical protein
VGVAGTAAETVLCAVGGAEVIPVVVTVDAVGGDIGGDFGGDAVELDVAAGDSGVEAAGDPAVDPGGIPAVDPAVVCRWVGLTLTEAVAVGPVLFAEVFPVPAVVVPPQRDKRTRITAMMTTTSTDQSHHNPRRRGRPSSEFPPSESYSSAGRSA